VKYSVFGLVCCTLCLSQLFSDNTYIYPAASKNPYPYGPKKETTSEPTQHELNSGIPHSFRFVLKHREANGIGYNQGYTSLDGFFLFTSIGNWHPYFDARAHVFNNGRPAANLGFGVRYLPDSIRAVFGINGFFDFKNTAHSTFEQVGGGFEILGEKWGMRANGYFPIFTRNNTYNIGFYKFYQHHALFRASHELAFTGFDVSLNRVLIQRRKWNLSSTLDGYMFFADYKTNAKGGLFKIRSEMFRNFAIEGQVSYDSYFKYIGQVQASFTIPFGKKVSINRTDLLLPERRSLCKRIAEEVDRFEMIVTTKHPIDSAATDPRTGDPLFIVFVNNMASKNGNGTAESPFPTLLGAQLKSSPKDMIYVFTGDGTSREMDTGINLKEGQWLQGSSLPFFVGTAFGPCAVPRQTLTEPSLASFFGSTVVLANNTIVSGFNLNSPVVNIRGDGVRNVQISDNKLRNSIDFDIILNAPSGNVVLANNISYSENGLFIQTDQNLHLTLQGNDFANRGLLNMDIAFTGSSTGIVVLEKRNEFHDALEGSVIAARDTSTLHCKVNECDFTSIPDAAPYCLKILADNNSNVIALASNNLFRSSTAGLVLGTDQTATADWYVVNNQAHYTGHNSPIFPFGFFTEGSSTATLLLGGNSADAEGYLLDNLSGTATFYVKSPTLNITGLEEINTGDFTTSGSITYVPFPDPPIIPIIR